MATHPAPDTGPTRKAHSHNKWTDYRGPVKTCTDNVFLQNGPGRFTIENVTITEVIPLETAAGFSLRGHSLRIPALKARKQE
jgi:hypothetical protein